MSRKRSSQPWRVFLRNHTEELASMEFLVGLQQLLIFIYVLVFLSHQRLRVIPFDVAAHIEPSTHFSYAAGVVFGTIINWF
jgi:hypothetical protein